MFFASLVAENKQFCLH